jgi:glutamate 5-kinase
VRILTRDGRELGRGLTTVSSVELREIMGLASEEVRRRLGPVGDAVVHRDHLVLTVLDSPPSGPAGAEEAPPRRTAGDGGAP